VDREQGAVAAGSLDDGRHDRAKDDRRDHPDEAQHTDGDRAASLVGDHEEDDQVGPVRGKTGRPRDLDATDSGIREHAPEGLRSRGARRRGRRCHGRRMTLSVPGCRQALRRRRPLNHWAAAAVRRRISVVRSIW